MTFFNRKGKLYIQFKVDGKQYQRSTRLDDTSRNRKLVEKEVVPKLQVKILKGEFDQTSKQIKDFNFYATQYKKSKEMLKTYASTRGIVDNKILPVFGKRKIDEIKRIHVKEFSEALLRTVSPHRTRVILNALVSIFDIAMDYEHIKTNPAMNIKLPKHVASRVIQPFSREEVQLLIEKAEGWFQNIVAIALYTGMRQGEIIALTWEDIDLENKTVNVNKRVKKGEIASPKTRSSIRLVPILDILLPYLKHQYILCQERKCTYVFFNPRTNKPFFDANKLLPYWYELLSLCKIERRVFYNTRHTFITLMIRSNVSILDIAQIVGHKNTEEIVRTYARYLHNEHLHISRSINVFTDKFTDSSMESL